MQATVKQAFDTQIYVTCGRAGRFTQRPNAAVRSRLEGREQDARVVAAEPEGVGQRNVHLRERARRGVSRRVNQQCRPSRVVTRARTAQPDASCGSATHRMLLRGGANHDLEVHRRVRVLQVRVRVQLRQIQSRASQHTDAPSQCDSRPGTQPPKITHHARLQRHDGRDRLNRTRRTQQVACASRSSARSARDKAIGSKLRRITPCHASSAGATTHRSCSWLS